MRPYSLCFALILGALLGQGCARPQAVFSFEKPLMHTLWDFSVVAGSRQEAQKAVDLAGNEIERLDQVLAMWRPESELAAFNAKAGQGPVHVSADLDSELDMGQKVSELSQGASDCTVGPLVQLLVRESQGSACPRPPRSRRPWPMSATAICARKGPSPGPSPRALSRT